MRFVEGTGGVWLLVDESAPSDACLIATLRGLVEVLAMKRLCEARLISADCLDPFEIPFEGRTYQVTPYSDRSGKLSLRIDGSDGSLSRVETEFRSPEDT